VTTQNTAACTDLDACTVNDVCAEGACVSGPELVCDDGDACTTDSCDDTDGCQYEALTPCCGNGVIEGDEACDEGNANGNDVCLNDCTVPVITDWRIGTWNGTPVMGIKNCAPGDYFCQAEDACEQATEADCVWQAYTCTGYAEQNGSFYPATQGNPKTVSITGGSSLNWAVTSDCADSGANGSCEHGAGGPYGNLCCCSCLVAGEQWNEGNVYCGVGIWEPY